MSADSRSLTAGLRGQRVIVESEQGQRFEGYLDQVAWPDRHVRLRDVIERPGGARYPSAVVASVDWIVPAAGDVEVVAADPRDVERGPFAVDAFELASDSENISAVAQQGVASRFPVLTRRNERLELVEGHWALWAAQQAGLTSHPAIVESLSRREHAARFAFDHFPLPHHLDGGDDRPRGSYGEEALQDSIERYFEALGDEALEIWPVRFNAKRLGVPSDTVAGGGH